MSIEIKELVIQTHIFGNAEQAIPPEEIESIIEECIARVLEILKQKNEW